MGLLSRHKREFKKADELFKGIEKVSCPFFSKNVTFSSDGFHHLQFNEVGSERDKNVQILKFSLINSAKIIIEKSGTIQEYRKQWGAVGRKKAKDGSRKMKEMQYWGFVAITGNGDSQIRVKVIVRQVGNGEPHFWSVMPDTRLKTRGTFKFASEDIADE
ncbi:hypothetical protein ACFL6I_10610 [candidate division KSB1 bacterium]